MNHEYTNHKRPLDAQNAQTISMPEGAGNPGIPVPAKT
jgi:hypothetical protein